MGRELVGTVACPTLRGRVSDTQCDEYTARDGHASMYFLHETDTLAAYAPHGGDVEVFEQYSKGAAPLPDLPAWCKPKNT